MTVIQSPCPTISGHVLRCIAHGRIIRILRYMGLDIDEPPRGDGMIDDDAYVSVALLQCGQ